MAELATYQGPLINWLKTANLIYFVFLPFKLAGLPPEFIVKIFGPLLFGGLTLSFYFWTRYFLKFSKLKAILASLLIVFQLATLRLSWDLYRNELGLIFFFLALINLDHLRKIKNLILFVLFCLLVVLSNELVTVILFLVLLVKIYSLSRQKKFQEVLWVAGPLAVVGLIFGLVVSSSGQVLYNPHVIFTSESNYLIWRYLFQYQQTMPYQEFFNIVTGLFLLCYQFLLPFALYGFWLLRKQLILSAMTLWLLIGTFSALLFSGTGIIVWERWLIMLAFPFACYTVEGVFQLGKLLNFKKIKKLKYLTLSLAALFWFGFFALQIRQVWPFLTSSYSEATPPLANDALNEYFPRTMIHNSVGISRIDNTLNCIKWLDQNTPSGSVILVDNRYRGLVLSNFEMDNRFIITNAWSEQFSRTSFEYAKGQKYWPIYLLWNNTGSIKGFDLVYASGNVGIFKAKSY
ncbi:MAG: hypothetical protein M1429_03660 [Patescibacteria group bacterium]|nr:hypothetical protein [Patescibacteria group bacterium]